MSTTMGQTNTGMGQTNTSSQTGLTNRAEQHQEGPLAKTIEQQTAKLPSDTFLWAALGSMGVSAVLQMMGKKQASLFVGDWVAPFLLFGVYNKIVKLQGSDKTDRGH